MIDNTPAYFDKLGQFFKQNNIEHYVLIILNEKRFEVFDNGIKDRVELLKDVIGLIEGEKHDIQ